jgi:hypothetical protein
MPYAGGVGKFESILEEVTAHGFRGFRMTEVRSRTALRSTAGPTSHAIHR